MDIKHQESPLSIMIKKNYKNRDLCFADETRAFHR